MVADGYVVDTGVFVRWYVPQVGYEHAREAQAAFFAGDLELTTTDAARYELPHVLRKVGLLHGHLTAEECVIAARALDDLELLVRPDADALQRAAALARDRTLRFFDALFVDLALVRSLPLLTSDAGLARATAGLLPVVVLRGIG